MEESTLGVGIRRPNVLLCNPGDYSGHDIPHLLKEKLRDLGSFQFLIFCKSMNLKLAPEVFFLVCHLIVSSIFTEGKISQTVSVKIGFTQA